MTRPVRFATHICLAVGLSTGLLFPRMCFGQRMPQDNFFYVTSLGSEGSGDGQFNQPYGLDMGTNGYLYVVDRSNNRIHVVDTNGTYILKWGSYGSGDGQFNSPQDVAVATNGLVFVADTGNNRIQVFDSTGSFVRKWGSQGSGDGQFDALRGVAVHEASGLVLASERNNFRVQVFQQDGTFVRKWGSFGSLDGQFEGYDGPCVDIGIDDLVYVADPGNGRIQVFDIDGNFIRKWGAGNHSNLRISAGPDLLWIGKNAGPVYLDYAGTFLKEIAPLPYSFAGATETITLEDGTVFATMRNADCIAVFRRGYRTMTPAGAVNAPPLPIVLAAQQRPASTLVDIDFRIEDADDTNVCAAALAFAGGTNSLNCAMRLSTLVENTQSNLGANVPTAQDLRITWNAGDDWDTDFGNVKFRIMAQDDRDLMDFHYITIPSNDPLPELTVNCSPVTSDDMLQCWYWLIATNDAAISLVSGEVYGVSGAYSNQVLAQDTTTTTTGREFLFERMAVREATADELARAATAGTPGVTNQWDPRNKIGDRPSKVNEYGFDTGGSGYWIVPND